MQIKLIQIFKNVIFLLFDCSLGHDLGSLIRHGPLAVNGHSSLQQALVGLFPCSIHLKGEGVL